MLVIDASVVLEVLLSTADGVRLQDELLNDRHQLNAPHLIDLEVIQVMRRYVRKREISVERADQAINDFYDLGIVRYSHTDQLAFIWAMRDNLTAYDGSYVALARAMKTTLWTRDAKLAKAADKFCSIKLV